MIPSAVKGYGFEVEPFTSYLARWPTELSNFPECVIENWVYRHWSSFEQLWLDKKIELFKFSETTLANADIMEIGHGGDLLETLDYWGDELFCNRIRRQTWLAEFMLCNGTSPAPIIVALNAAGLEHPRGLTMHPNELIEGHMRLAYLRGMIRHGHPQLKETHSVWHVTLPTNSFKPNMLRGSS